MRGSRLLVLADVGGPAFHAGGEATLEANLQRLAATAPQTAVRVLGCDAGAREIAAALIESDALLISGRCRLLGQPVVAIGAAARRRIPVVTGGQTIGLDLSDVEREVLSRALATVAAVGVRDVPSAIVAAELGVPGERIFYQVDDAFGLAGVHPRDAALVRAAATPFMAVTLDATFVGPSLVRIGSQLAAVAREAGLRVVLIPHAGPRDADGAVASLLADQLAGEGVEATLVPLLPATEVVWLTRRAAAVVSSRLHPLVFGLSAGVPCLALHRDASTRSELQGALSHVGMRLWSVPPAEIDAGGLTVKFRELWRHRDALRDVIRVSLPTLKRRDARRWHHVLTRLGIPPTDATAHGPAPVGWPAEAMTLAKAFQARARLTGSDPLSEYR